MSGEVEENKEIELLKKKEDTRDMMVTAYSILRDNCIRNDRIIDLIEISFSIIVLTMTFYDYSDDQFGVIMHYLIIVLAMTTLLLAFLKQKWDFGGMAEKYRHAAEKCYEAKSLLRTEIEKRRNKATGLKEYGDIAEQVDAIC